MSNDNKNKKNDPVSEIALAVFGGAVMGLIVGAIGDAVSDQMEGSRGVFKAIAFVFAVAGCLGPIGTAIAGGLIGGAYALVQQQKR